MYEYLFRVVLPRVIFMGTFRATEKMQASRLDNGKSAPFASAGLAGELKLVIIINILMHVEV